MAKKKSQSFRVDSGQPERTPTVDAARAEHLHKDGKIAVNLKYYQRSAECFSKWQKKELEAFSKWVEKISARTEAQITSTTKTCHAHKPGKTASGYTMPDEVSPDVKMYGLDVTSGGRVHGFFESNQFFLVWLD